MSTDIENLDITALQELTKKAEALIEKKKQEKIQDTYNQVLALAEELGMSLEELIAYGQENQVAYKRTVAPRYRHPDDASQTWTGRGKKPRWVVEALEQGKTLDDLVI